MPALTEANVRHLLRRTEFVDRPARVTELMSLGSIEEAVVNVMSVPAKPPSVSFDGLTRRYDQGIRLGQFWLDQMAGAGRPFGERMAFFWHGHICTDNNKVKFGRAMREQIDLFRTVGLGPNDASTGNIGALMATASTQVALLRYLDNDLNLASSPNQNFARELMELFLLGVGNYTEADVEAATAAWTGHGRPDFETDRYVFDPGEHERRAQRFLGRSINTGARPASEAGRETIEVILGTGPLGSGIVPAGAQKNVGRSTRDVAAEFLTLKLWQEFGEATSGSVPAGVRTAMTSALTDSGFDIRPWVRVMLVHDDFYASATRSGLVRQPVEYVVALLTATRLAAAVGVDLDAMGDAGQRPLYPPDVSGWRPNGYWVNASAMGARQQLAQHCVRGLTGPGTPWDRSDGYVDLIGGRLSRPWLESGARSGAEIVDSLIRLTGLASVPSDARRLVSAHLDDRRIARTMRLDALILLFTSPHIHLS